MTQDSHYMYRARNDPDIKADVMDIILKISRKLAKKQQGALFIIADREKISGNYRLHSPQPQFKGNLLTKGMDTVVEKLATLDGALILTPEGELVAYGSKVLKFDTFPGFGTKYSAARGITLSDESATAILVLKGSGLIKVFRKGEIVLSTSAVDIKPSTLDVVSRLLTNRDTALLITAGVTVTTSIIPVTEVLIVGGIYIVIKTAGSVISSNLKKEKK